MLSVIMRLFALMADLRVEIFISWLGCNTADDWERKKTKRKNSVRAMAVCLVVREKVCAQFNQDYQILRACAPLGRWGAMGEEMKSLEFIVGYLQAIAMIAICGTLYSWRACTAQFAIYFCHYDSYIWELMCEWEPDFLSVIDTQVLNQAKGSAYAEFNNTKVMVGM